MDLVKPWLVSHAVKELGQVLQWRDQGENLSLPGGEAGGSVFEDDGKTIKIKPTKLGQTAQLIKFGKSVPLIEATLSDSKTRIPITFDRASIRDYETKARQPVTHKTLGAVIQIQEYEIRATALGPRSDRLSLYVTKFKLLGANGSGTFGEVPRGIESEEAVGGLLRKLESQRQKQEQLGSADSSTRRSSLNSSHINSPVKEGKLLDEAHSLAESSIFATQMGRIPSGLSTGLLPSGKDLARHFDNTPEDLGPPNNADLIRGFQRRQPKQPSPKSSPTFDDRDRTSNKGITSTEDMPSQLERESSPAVISVPENPIQANGKRRQDAHFFTSSSYARRSESASLDKGTTNSASVNGKGVPAIVPAKRKRRERVSARDVKIHKDQENLLARPDSWLPAEPSQREPMANIPIQILNELNYVADSNSEVPKRSRSPQEFEHEQRRASRLQDMSTSASMSEEDEELEWASSPVREAAETLPADSSRPGSSQSNKFSTNQIPILSNVEATSLGFPASSIQGHTTNNSQSVASSPQPTQSLHNLSLNGESLEIMSTTENVDNATLQNNTPGSMSGDEHLPIPCTGARGRTCGPTDPVQSLDGYHSCNDNRIGADHDTPSPTGSAVSPSQMQGGEFKRLKYASASRSPPPNVQVHSHRHINPADSQSMASPTFSESSIEISIPQPMGTSESHSEQASSPIELPSTAIQAQVPFTQVKRTPYVNGFISMTESTSVEHPNSSGTQDVSRISGTSLGNSNVLSSAQSNDAAAAVLERDKELELPPISGEQPSGRSQMEGSVKDPGAARVRDLQTNFPDSTAEEPLLQELVEELHSDMDASNPPGHHPLKMQDEEFGSKYEAIQGSTKRKDDFASALLSRTSKRAKLSDFLPEHFSQEEAQSTNLRNLVDRHRKDFFTSRRSSASSAQVSNPASPAKLAGGILPSLLSHAERRRSTQKPDDDSIQTAGNTGASSNAASRADTPLLRDPEAAITPDRENDLLDKAVDLRAFQMSEELGKQHSTVAEAQGSPKDTSYTGATDDNSDQTSPKEQKSAGGSPLPAPGSVVRQANGPVAPVISDPKTEVPEESGSTSRIGPLIENIEHKVASDAPPSLDDDTEATPDKGGEKPESIRPPANLQIQEPQNIAPPANLQIQEPQNVAPPANLPIQDPQDKVTPANLQMQDPKDKAPPADLQIQDSQDKSPSHAEKGSRNPDVVNQPKFEDHQSVLETFQASYPSYTGNQKHFSSMCLRIRKLMVDGGCPHQFLWDDFIIRQRTDYSLYVQKCTEDAEDPVSYEQYYSNAIEEPLHTKKVVTVRNLHDALPEQSEKSFSDRPAYQSAVLPRIGASSTWSDTSSLDSREPPSLTKMMRSSTKQGRVASPLATESTTFGKPQSPQQPVQLVTDPVTATLTSPPSRVISPPRTARKSTGKQEAMSVTIDLTMDDEESSPVMASSRLETLKGTGPSAKGRRSLPWSNNGTPSRAQVAVHDLGQSLDKRSTPQSTFQASSSSRLGKDRQHEVIDVEATGAPLVDKGKQLASQRPTLDTASNTDGSRSLVPNSRGLIAGADDYQEHETSQEPQRGWWRDPDTPYNKFVRDMAAIQPARGNSYASPDNVRRGKAIQKQRQKKLKHVHMAELGL